MTRSTPRRQPAIATPPRKPMAWVRRATLFERAITERLSSAAVELLIDRAELLSEGRWTGPSLVLTRFDGRPAPRRSPFFGSTMLTLDLARLADAVREPPSPVAARRVADLLATDARLTARLRVVAEREASRVAGRPLRATAVDVRVRVEDARVLVDLDVEADVAPSFAAAPARAARHG